MSNKICSKDIKEFIEVIYDEAIERYRFKYVDYNNQIFPQEGNLKYSSGQLDGVGYRKLLNSIGIENPPYELIAKKEPVKIGNLRPFEFSDLKKAFNEVKKDYSAPYFGGEFELDNEIIRTVDEYIEELNKKEQLSDIQDIFLSALLDFKIKMETSDKTKNISFWDSRSFDEIESIDFINFTIIIPDDIVELKCECGAKKCGFNTHSSWCPLYNKGNG